VSIGFLTRLEIDLIDSRTRPDGDYKWILHCRDHFSKFSWAYPLRTKEAAHVAQNLSSLFYQFGPCKILQSDNGKEFTAGVIKDLKLIWPGVAIINGRPRHPQSQGLVERSNATLYDILGKILQDRGADRWTERLPVAVYSMNTSLARGVKTTPFEIVFGQKPRSPPSTPTLISNFGEEATDSCIINTTDLLTVTVTVAYDDNVLQSIQDTAPSSNTNNADSLFDQTDLFNLGDDGSRHAVIRQQAAASYLLNAQKQIIARNTHVKNLSDNCKISRK
ncbi:unnamed protein product, partial [Didymodactylos carnosus]